MSIPINSLCIECHFRKRMELARQLGSEEQAMELARCIMKNIIRS